MLLPHFCSKSFFFFFCLSVFLFFYTWFLLLYLCIFFAVTWMVVSSTFLSAYISGGRFVFHWAKDFGGGRVNVFLYNDSMSKTVLRVAYVFTLPVLAFLFALWGSLFHLTKSPISNLHSSLNTFANPGEPLYNIFNAYSLFSSSSSSLPLPFNLCFNLFSLFVSQCKELFLTFRPVFLLRFLFFRTSWSNLCLCKPNCMALLS